MFRSLTRKAAASSLLGVLLCALIGALAGGLGAARASAQAITNTASATWSQSGRNFSTLSNAVTFQVVPAGVTIETFAAAPGADELTYMPSRCGGAAIVAGASGGSQPVIAGVSPSATVRIGGTFFFRITAPRANHDPGAIDTLETTLTTTSGDHETIVIHETGLDTGIFAGAVATTAIPPQPVAGDCRLSVASGDHISIASSETGSQAVLASARMDVLADPYGFIFDSEDGSPVNGVRVTLLDAATGAPARVFAGDGVTSWPSTVITGEPVIDGAGNVEQLPAGEYRFPLVAIGHYRLRIEQPAPYSAPSTASPAQLAGIMRPDGLPVLIAPGSFGGDIPVLTVEPVRVDVPLDRPGVAVAISKTASRHAVEPGDAVFYTVTVRNPDSAHAKTGVVVTDRPASTLRLRRSSVRIDGAAQPDAVAISPDGKGLAITLGTLAAGARRTITYVATVAADAGPGPALNTATVQDSRGLTGTSGAVVEVREDGLTARMTLIGRVAGGGCATAGHGEGIAGVRVMLEDGSFAVTDADGRYHFDGVLPGNHVVQVMESTLPAGARFVDCARSTRSAGSAISRFVGGQGGSLVVADFQADTTGVDVLAPASDSAPAEVSDKEAAGGDIDWLAQASGPPAFLFPAPDHNPRAPVVRVAIRHAASQTVELAVDGKLVDKVAMDGIKLSADRTRAVSLWRGIPLDGERTRLSATVRNADGSVAVELSRDVHFTEAPAEVRLVPELSRLVADGRTRPVVALRFVDRHGRPVHAGISGDLRLGAPYETAEAVDALQSRALTGMAGRDPRWTIRRDDGVALVELAPTMVSGALQLDFAFTQGQQQRRQTLNAWVVPGDIPWTLVGLAEGSVGARNIADTMERSGRLDSDLGQNGRVAFYAKGRVTGGTLLTMAYDSARQRRDAQLLGAIDPKAYYTIYADGSSRRFDAASRRKLYVRLESRSFFALFGDFDTGFAQTQLARYQRTVTGVKAEYNGSRLRAQAFATKVASRHRRDEIQGGGISGPYRLRSRSIIANSEVVVLEVRDRLRSEVIVDRRTLTRFLDYDIDLLAGTITFKQPVLSRDSGLNPQFIVVDYEIDPGLAAAGAINAGVRAEWTGAGGKLRLGATGITDKGEGARTDLLAADVRYRPTEQTEFRAEAAISTGHGATANAWLVEGEHHDGKLSLLAYARSADADFGVGQVSGAQTGRRKFGADASLSLTEELTLSASAWLDQSLTDAGHREAVRVRGDYRTRPTDFWLGASALRDRLADGRTPSSLLLEGGISKRLLDGRLQLDAATSVALGNADAADLPARHQFSARYAITSWLKVLGTYEMARGSTVDADTARAGFEIQPWRGGRVTTSLGRQAIAEEGARSFAAFGLTQSFEVNAHLSLDATLDMNKVLGGIDAGRVLNRAHPLASGGHLAGNGALVEDFTAITLGGTWRAGRWTTTARGEWREGEQADRRGLTFGAIRQLGEGRMLGSGFSWTRAQGSDGSASAVFDGMMALAWRPATSRLAVLSKIEFRADTLSSAAEGQESQAGNGVFTGGHEARSRRVIGSVSADWSPWATQDDGTRAQRLEIGFFGALRYKLDGYADETLSGTTVLAGLDLRIGLGQRFEIGGRATVRANLADHTTSIAYGPQLGFVPAKDMLLSVGYSFAGFRDRDFAAARTTDKGLFASLKMKFDADSFGWLGLGRRD